MSETKKKSKLLLIIPAALILAAALAVTLPILIKNARAKDTAAKQNYVASKLIEIGYFEDGQNLALGTDAAYPNDISKELIVISSGFMYDLDGGADLADKFLMTKDNDIISSLRDAYLKTAKAPETYYDRYSGFYQLSGVNEDEFTDTLFDCLSEIQKKIKVKKTGSELQSMIELCSGGSSDRAVAYTELEYSDSPAILRLRTMYSIENNSMNELMDNIDSLLAADDSFPNRALAANVIATMTDENDLIQNSDETKIQEKYDARMKLYEKVEDELAKENADYSDLEYLRTENKKIRNLAEQIDTLTKELESETVKRAINYIESTTPAAAKKKSAYDIERSFLYFKAGEPSRAKKLLTLLFTTLESKNRADDSVSASMAQINDWYRDNTDSSSGHQILRNKWNSIAKLLGIPVRYYSDSDDFFELILETLDTMHRSLLIRDIDSSDFPVVRVTVNAADEVRSYLKKRNLAITDTDGKVKNVKVTSLSKGTSKQNISVMLVVDTSGSMGGTPLEDTKDAVKKFVDSTGADIPLGLVEFNHEARIAREPELYRRGLLIELDKLGADGGTDISNALKTAVGGFSAVSGRRIIILLSDGADGNPDSIDQVLSDVNSAGITVYTIGFGGADSEYLTKIASRCGGKYFEAYSSEFLSEIYNSIGSSMANDYVIEYLALEKPEEYDRDFRVILKKAEVSARRGYTVGVSADEIPSEPTRIFGAFRQIAVGN